MDEADDVHNTRDPERDFGVEQKENKAFVVVIANAGADPWTVMVEAKCAPLTVSVFLVFKTHPNHETTT